MTAIQLRPAHADDAIRVWQWNFAPEVRAQSIDPRLATFAEHDRWWRARLADPARATWIIEAAGAPVGVVRMDPLGAGATGDRISIALAAEARGRGIGRRAIALACAAWRRPVLAQIFATNAASVAAFGAAGFVPMPAADPVDPRVHLYRWSP